MKPDVIAVITYPGHCVSTVLTIKNLIELTGWNVPVYVIYDDCCGPYLHYPGNYIEDITPFYQEHILNELHFVPFSSGKVIIPENHLRKMGGWHRQQFVKLMLNRYLPFEYNTFYVTDGDVLQHVPLEYGCTPINFVNPSMEETHTKFKAFISHMLGIDQVELYGKYDDEPEIREAFTHYAPFRWLERSVLGALAGHVAQVHSTVYSMHLYHIIHASRHGGPYKMTEWDLIEVFKKKYIYDQNRLQYWPVCDKLNNSKTGFWTFYGTDKEVDNNLLLEYNITVPPVLQNKLKSINYAM